MQHLSEKIVCPEQSFFSQHMDRPTYTNKQISKVCFYHWWTQPSSSACTDCVQYRIRRCLSQTTTPFLKSPGSKCVDYGGIHSHNACDNGLKQLLWEKSVWRMDYSKALLMECWTQELIQAVGFSSGCFALDRSNVTVHARVPFSVRENIGSWEVFHQLSVEKFKQCNIVVRLKMYVCFPLGLWAWFAFIYFSYCRDTGTHWTN